MRPCDPRPAGLPGKILMTTDTVGGVWTYSLELARALGRQGVCVALATMGAPLTPDQRRQAARIATVEVYESAFHLEWMEDPWRDVARAGEWLLALEKTLKPDVVHLNGYAHGALHWRAPVVMVGHSCVLSWWQAVKGEAAPASWNRYRREVRRGLHAADMVVAPTAGMLSELRRLYGLPGQERVIFNGRSDELFAPAEKKPFVCTAGRLWDEAKNVGALCKVAPSLPWRVLVAGEARHPEGGGAAQVRNVRYLGKLSPVQLAACFGHASIYALPARYEPFGLSAVEAALAGCALVLGDIPTLREVWQDAALYVPPDDTRALEKTLKDLIGDTRRRQQLAQAARRVAQRYTPARMANGYLEAYQLLLGRRAAARAQVGTAVVGAAPMSPR